MSEYQYYEFLALDRPLTDAELGRVRALSTRAQISRTRFVNEYQWGDFKGDPDVLLDRFYDAHLYFANWGTRILMLGLPFALLDLSTADEYCDGESAFVRRTGKNVVLRWCSEDEDGEEDWADGGPGPLGALVGVRAELAAGDLRPLYLGWLAAVSAGSYGSFEESDDRDEDAEVLEPAVPPGLDRLTGAQRALAGFLRVDADLLDAAAEASAEPGAEADETALAVDQWIKGLTTGEKDAALRRLLGDDDPHARAELLRAARPEARSADGRRRTVRTLVEAAAMRSEARERERRRQAAAERERREQQARQERERRLDELAGQGERPWSEVSALIAGKSARHYQAAVALLADLRELSTRGGEPDGFARRLADLRTAHGAPAQARLDRTPGWRGSALTRCAEVPRDVREALARNSCRRVLIWRAKPAGG